MLMRLLIYQLFRFIREKLCRTNLPLNSIKFPVKNERKFRDFQQTDCLFQKFVKKGGGSVSLYKDLSKKFCFGVQKLLQSKKERKRERRKEMILLFCLTFFPSFPKVLQIMWFIYSKRYCQSQFQERQKNMLGNMYFTLKLKQGRKQT